MVKKLRLCSVVFEFSEELPTNNDSIAKDKKRKHLLDLIEHVTTEHKWFCEEIVPIVFDTVSSNIFRPLPPSPYEEGDP